MKRVAAFAPAALIGIVAFALCFYWATRPVRQMAMQDGDGIAWLAHEFHLTAEQTARVQQLHDDYEPRCEEMCRKVAELTARLNVMISQNSAITPEIDAALRQSAELQTDCRREMLIYIYGVAAVMPPGDRERYLALMKPRVLAPGLPHVPALAAHHHS